jgi:hypothetical protein
MNGFGFSRIFEILFITFANFVIFYLFLIPSLLSVGFELETFETV